MTDNNQSQNLSFFETTGFSMWPFLKAGEKLIIKKTQAEDLKIGDIILYRSNSQLICHRLIKKIKEKGKCLIFTRGDSSVSRPEPVTEDMFIGRAISIVKNGKTINLINLRHQFINRLIIILAPLIGLGIKIGKILLQKK